ncbi:hypothetical protein BC342_32145 [Streptomyces olivaceus]|nr:hypothetical protein BC342_32145 [Streptomyces olivaceus]
MRPAPAAKNAYRQASCSSSPGSTTPRQANAGPTRPPISRPSTRHGTPMAAATPRAVPEERATASRQAVSGTPLKRTTSGSVASPRETLSTTP